MKEYRVLALVGSRKGEKSNTGRLCELVIAAAQKQCGRDKISAEILTSDKWGIAACSSCGICFRQGYCPQDEKDGMKSIREKLLLSDGILFASPVYAGAVSGDMKQLIDRLSFWLHTMPLIGKTSVLLSTADSNHGDGAISYMKQITEKMGAVTAASQNIFVNTGRIRLTDEYSLQPLLFEIAAQLCRGFKGELQPAKEQENYFAMQLKRMQGLRTLWREYGCLRSGEEAMWEKQGYFSGNPWQNSSMEKYL